MIHMECSFSRIHTQILESSKFFINVLVVNFRGRKSHLNVLNWVINGTIAKKSFQVFFIPISFMHCFFILLIKFEQFWSENSIMQFNRIRMDWFMTFREIMGVVFDKIVFIVISFIQMVVLILYFR